MAPDDGPAPRTPEGREVLRLADLYARAVIDYGYLVAGRERDTITERELRSGQAKVDAARDAVVAQVRAMEHADAPG